VSASELPRVPAGSATRVEQEGPLRRVAAIVAGGAAPADVFAAIAGEVAHELHPRLVQILRWERDGTATVVGTSGEPPNPFPVGSNWTWHEPGIAAVAERARRGFPVLIEDLGKLAGTVADAGRRAGIGSAAGAPIVVDGAAWGLIGVGAVRGAPLPDRIEERLEDYAGLVATAISNSAMREQLARLADEQTALRRVATLVARGVPPADVFEAVVEELGRLLGVGSTGLVRFEDEQTVTVVAGWGRLSEVIRVGARLPVGGMNVISQIARTGRPARLDYVGHAGTGDIADRARRLDTQAAAGGPIVVAGRLWGAMIAAALEGDALPPDSEARLGQFTELIGAAIANAEARVEVARLADEQAALRRVATLVAGQSPAGELFAKASQEVAGVLGPAISACGIVRFEPDDTATVVGVWSAQPVRGLPVGASLPIDGSGVSARVLRERRAVRVDDYAAAEGAIADHARARGVRSALGCPILVEDRLWGAMVAARYEDEPFPSDAERCISQFTELVATALANARARAALQRLAEEQAALRRVATLVAEAAAPPDVFDAVVAEVAQVLRASQVGLMRAESSQEITIVAHRGQPAGLVRVGMRLRLDGDSATARVIRTGRSARLDIYDEGSGAIARIARRNNANATVGAPITVEGRLWGVITASWERHDAAPADAEERLAEFAQLLGTAIANAHSRNELTASRARVVTAGDAARRRVVRDLHDGAQQRMVHTLVTLKLAQRALGDDSAQAASLIAEAVANAEQGNAELRELAHGILPAVLTRGGLRAGVDSLVSRLELPVHADVAGTRLPLEVEASAYFIVAEALTNVVKHAQAARAEVSAVVDAGTLRLEVRDDGIGGADPEGTGLLGLADRAAALGGRLRVESPRGAGTVVTAELPVSS
jgi:GAF domain-containing protein